MNAPTPRTDAAESHYDYKEGMADFARQLERELSKSQAREAQLRAALNKASATCCDGQCYVPVITEEALALPPPPVVPLADAEALVEALNRLTSGDYGFAGIEHIASEAIETFHEKHPKP